MKRTEATIQQRIVMDALQVVCGFEAWRFKPVADGIIIQSGHDVDYLMKADGTLRAQAAAPDCGKCNGTGFIQKKGSFSMTSCACAHGRREVAIIARKYGLEP
jgi:hypothetical protein